jgi:signal transduction histidine kinase
MAVCRDHGPVRNHIKPRLCCIIGERITADCCLAAAGVIQFNIVIELTVRGSEAQLSSLCSILLDNAVKYGSPGSTVELRLKAGDRSCALRLENRCDSLPDCPPERLFDRFYRADEARSQKGGFGIGLSAAQVITRQHRGRLEAEYPAGDRIAFTVTLPLA